ncbi:MAG: DNA polymerase III subunit gamma/tau [Alphaproteobacteria bacterium]|nr:DNA polymerase III subunit gamma/tau [Alphaproteobacteria bacterium]
MSQAALFNMASETPSAPHLVLARKYRPQNFSDLHGQDVLVRILTNGLKSGKLPQAFIFTGIRGVGKTTTARLLARALNCTGRDLADTVNPCGICENCTSISQDRHIDVIEMDAASRTGIDDIREVIEAAKYKAVMGKYKVYIIDEIHMLSKSAFNALLKTLEEPPAHVKFIFATTEIHKVPKTVLSRCMRFDLARISIKTLKELFAGIAAKEHFHIDDRALTLIAKAADGSARDGISMLDQARTMSMESVTAETVQQMLGLSEAGKIFDLLYAAIQGDARSAMQRVDELYAIGADPATLLNELLNLVHTLSCLKVDTTLLDDLGLTEADADACQSLAKDLTIPTLSRIWQVLMKGAEELQVASLPLQTLQMVILRLVYASSLPSLEDMVKVGMGENIQMPIKEHNPSQPLNETDSIHSFESLVNLVAKNKEPLIYAYLKADVHLVSFSHGTVEIKLNEGVPKDLPLKLSHLLKQWTGETWSIIASQQEAVSPTLMQQDEAKQQQEIEEIRKDPLVAKALEAFPGAVIESIE